MNIREAILKAADHIERNPHAWDFGCVWVPDCGTPGCALGWIGHFMGINAGESIGKVEAALGCADFEFYNLVTGSMNEHCYLTASEPAKIAAALRRYADEYHPAEKPKHVGIPASVRAIFDTAQSRALC